MNLESTPSPRVDRRTAIKWMLTASASALLWDQRLVGGTSAPSARNRFFTSQVWPQRSVAEVEGSEPIIAPPTSWIMNPPCEIDCRPLYSGRGITFPPIATTRSLNVLSMC